MRTDELDYDLPESRIARSPAPERDAARLLVVSRSDPHRLEHRIVRDLPEILGADDILVFNTTRVIPARFQGRNLATGGRVQGLYLGPADEPGCWRVLLKMRRHRPGLRIGLHHPDRPDAVVELELVERQSEDGQWIVRVVGAMSDDEALERVGLPPLPPYILAARRRSGEVVDRIEDVHRYQTVYAHDRGSVAAPTAGLHFTPELLDRLRTAGVGEAQVTLHVGRGTFLPVETAVLEEHPMHSERCVIDQPTLDFLTSASDAGRRVIPVGTTSCRAIESFAGRGLAGEIETDILISPGYQWKLTDGLMTNFHQPRSTLLAMVAALFPEGMDRLREIYDAALAEEYRFLSFGDAMLVLP
ncbi:MAG TPA: tRNA preQ1(34) S-adenosylmethionine ribosyltransferase-isomerase QueA [Phycisphaerales bacterium]|nr:tRNA preQ1(34) S-adenosylmethionine ribosyltransferase-isomerase QueA [Phycisphaerales bacterium]